jgi:hypothetical protein
MVVYGLGARRPRGQGSKSTTIASQPDRQFNSQQKDGCHGYEEEEEGQEGCEEEVSSFSREHRDRPERLFGMILQHPQAAG